MTASELLRSPLTLAQRAVVLWRSHRRMAVRSAAFAFLFAAIPLVAPLNGLSARAAGLEPETQTFTVTAGLPAPTVERDDYSVLPGYPTLAASGTNYDWARAVLLAAGWPQTESNITVITRWMRQENYIDSWWNRNNPLNNGWGSGGGSGLGSYVNLVSAAENAAKALKTHPGYAAVAAGFAASAPTEVIEQAIWASPWASGHYNNGKHWHYTPVPEVKAPRSAWGY